MGYQCHAEGIIIFPAPFPGAVDPVLRGMQRYIAAHSNFFPLTADDDPDIALADLLHDALSPAAFGFAQVTRDRDTGAATATFSTSSSPSSIAEIIEALAATGAAGHYIGIGDEPGDADTVYFGPHTHGWNSRGETTGIPCPQPTPRCTCPGDAESSHPVDSADGLEVRSAHHHDCTHARHRTYQWDGTQTHTGTLADYTAWWQRNHIDTSARERFNIGQLRHGTRHYPVIIADRPRLNDTTDYIVSAGDEHVIFTRDNNAMNSPDFSRATGPNA
ncbi:hypothetical protein [Nocardia carnea]|uniref:hypothetical protein n=1 Tax=Nocardia carnea TaxID=37328 RepID=UPI0024560CE6|nr:hypothetical protein [Nocardia carnea]